RRLRTGGDHGQALGAHLLGDVVDLGLAGQHGGQAHGGLQVLAEVAGDLRAAQVRVDQAHRLAVVGQCQGEVGGDGGLALTGHAAGHRDDRRVVVHVEEAQVRAQFTELLGGGDRCAGEVEDVAVGQV